MKEYSSPEQENLMLANALREICNLGKGQNWRQAIVVRQSKKGAGNLDIRLYDVVNQRLAPVERAVPTEKASEVLKEMVSGGQPVLQVVKNQNGTHTVRYVDAEFTSNLVRMPNGVNEALEVDF